MDSPELMVASEGIFQLYVPNVFYKLFALTTCAEMGSELLACVLRVGLTSAD